MRFPIDTHGLGFIAVGPPEALKEFEQGKPREEWQTRTNEHGEILHALPIVAMRPRTDGRSGNEAQIIRVTIVGEPKVTVGGPVQVEGLTALAWERDGRSGVSFRAEKITGQGAPAPAPAKPTGQG